MYILNVWSYYTYSSISQPLLLLMLTTCTWRRIGMKPAKWIPFRTQLGIDAVDTLGVRAWEPMMGARAHLMKYLRCALSICTHCVRVLMRTYKIRETPSVLVYIQSTCYVPSYVVEVIAARPAMRPCGAHLLTVQCGKEVTFWARCAVCLLAIIIIAQSSISSSSLFVFTSEVYSRATLARTATYINWWQWR